MQLALTRRLPLCYATLLGSHNSAITIADGYGNLDEQFQEYFQWIRWVVRASPPASLLCTGSQLRIADAPHDALWKPGIQVSVHTLIACSSALSLHM